MRGPFSIRSYSPLAWSLRRKSPCSDLSSEQSESEEEKRAPQPSEDRDSRDKGLRDLDVRVPLDKVIVAPDQPLNAVSRSKQIRRRNDEERGERIGDVERRRLVNRASERRRDQGSRGARSGAAGRRRQGGVGRSPRDPETARRVNSEAGNRGEEDQENFKLFFEKDSRTSFCKFIHSGKANPPINRPHRPHLTQFNPKISPKSRKNQKTKNFKNLVFFFFLKFSQ